MEGWDLVAGLDIYLVGLLAVVNVAWLVSGPLNFTGHLSFYRLGKQEARSRRMVSFLIMVLHGCIDISWC